MKKPVTARAQQTAEVGELIEAAFDNAAQYSSDPVEVAQLATQIVVRMLRRARRVLGAPPPVYALARPAWTAANDRP